VTTPVKLEFPRYPKNRGPLYWTRDANLWAGRRRLRADDSNNWRYDFEREYRNPAPALSSFGPPPAGATDPSARIRPISALLEPGKAPGTKIRFLLLGDTGEGDHSQYGLLPVIRAIQPDFLIINGDIAYPAGELQDFEEGFFDPYRDLRVPIWAVPGNHEYYSGDHGATFYELFCTRLHEDRWTRSGLRSVPQPGTYWELREEAAPAGADSAGRLVVIGVDSGQTGNLDGKISLARRFGELFDKSVGHAAGDRRQYDWLEERLQVADREQAKVIICFHIPSLVDGKHHGDIGLVRLHQMIASHPSVRLVVAAHIHSYQQYSPDTFGKYLAEVIGRSTSTPPHYIVCGNGGAGLSRSDFPNKPFATSGRCPDEKEWAAYVRDSKLWLSRYPKVRSGLVGKLARLVDRALGADPDEPRFLSMVLVEVDPALSPSDRIKVIPVWVRDLEGLVNGKVASVPQPAFIPGGPVLRVHDPGHRLTPEALQSCFLTAHQFTL
jgi:3',5'-cyclic AMP phosphodiesterase CpdA